MNTCTGTHSVTSKYSWTIKYDRKHFLHRQLENAPPIHSQSIPFNNESPNKFPI